jgi:SM-20-related protein
VPRSGVDVEICEEAIERPALQRLRAAMEARVAREATVIAGGEQRVIRDVRRAGSVAMPEDLAALTRGCFERLRPRLETRFSVQLGECEAPQFLRYERGDGFVAHQDSSSRPGDDGHLSRRSVSLVLFVSGRDTGEDGGEHAGGLLTFFDTSPGATWETCRVPIRAAAGTAVAFPSDLVHEVTPVRRGVRLSAVTWFPAA